MVLATHTIRQFLRHFPFRASPCASTFQLNSKAVGALRRILKEAGKFQKLYRVELRVISGMFDLFQDL
jgi:hypothetical protein